MSKYIYATVYEQFTGLKPPEPKSHKPRRRRGYGHPYRMRLNMQEEEQEFQEREHDEGGDILDSSDSLRTIEPKFETPRFNDSIDIASGNIDQTIKHRSNRVRSKPYNRTTQSFLPGTTSFQKPSEEKSNHAPKVTYKKRRHFLDKNESMVEA